MKQVTCCLLVLLTLMLVGCQKESETELPDNNNPGQPGEASRLVRMVYLYSPTDSAYTEFFYDAAGRWMGQRTVGDDDAVLTEGAEIKVERNSAGIITGYTVKENDRAGAGESIGYTVHYDAVAKRYTSRVYEFSLNGNTLVDSTVFVINNGKMATQRFIFKEKTTGLFLEVGKVEFVYDAAGNPVTISTFSKDPTSGSSEKELEVALQFDDKVAALNLGVEALVLDQLFFASPNNVSRISYKDLSNPAQPVEDLISLAYAYNAANKPITAVIAMDGGAIPVAFRYQ